MAGDLLDTRADQALEAARAMLADLEQQEQAAIATGDAETAVQRRSERLLMEEAVMMLRQRRAAAEKRRSKKAGGPPKGLGGDYTLDAQARKVLEIRDAGGGDWPNQEDVAGKMGVTERTLRTHAKWVAVMERAHALDRK